MAKNKIFLWIQTALCVLIAVLLASSAVRIFIDSSAYQAAGHPSEWIYTREKAAAALMPILPLFLLSFAMTVYGLVKGIKDEEADKPVQDVERTRDLVCARVAQPSEEMAKAAAPLYNTSPETAHRRVIIRRVLLVAAVIFVVLGVQNGSMKDVIVKAIRICTECVGIG